MLTAELEAKIANARKVEIYYNQPYEYRFAVVEYSCRPGKPLMVASYHIYGEELKTGKQLRCWNYYSSTNWCIIEDGFKTEDVAKLRMKELKEARKHGASNSM